MKKQRKQQPTQQQEVVFLTPEQFHELDTLARTEVGYPISLQRHEEITSFAHASGWAVGQFDLTGDEPVLIREAGCIDLANQIDLEKFRACKRPEMDWSDMKKEDVYRFIILHEIAHVRRGDPMFWLDIQLRDDFLFYDPRGRRRVALKYKGVIGALEADADRAAWAALYPGKPMPKCKDMPIFPEPLDDIIERFKDAREKYRRKSSNSISTDPRLYVPWNHRDAGPPFADSGERTKEAIVKLHRLDGASTARIRVPFFGGVHQVNQSESIF